MARSSEEQKRIESWFLTKARDAGVPIPPGELPGEEPDFLFESASCTLGIELSEVLRPASSNYGNLPVEEEAVHREVMHSAQRAYYAIPNAKPVHVSVYFTNMRGKRNSKQEMARNLTEFVQSNHHWATPAKIFMQDDAPDGFDSVLIDSEADPNNWWNGEGGGVTLSDIRPQVEARIAAKDKLVQTYRSNLPTDAHVWLLLYTASTVARSMPIPHGAEEWLIPFHFDRVFWFTSLEGTFVEFHRAVVL